MDFIKEFYAKMRDRCPDLVVRGFLTRDDMVYRLSTDTKVLSTVFELLVRPLVHEIAEEQGCLVKEPMHQNFYPDFTLMKSEGDRAKIAVDVKTTYRSFSPNGDWEARFTLGSYVSFLRGETKNIVFPFSQYVKHYIIGFIYSRLEQDTEHHVCTLEQRDAVPCPFEDVEFFVQEKYKIASDTPGSGNTENIGSISGRSVDAFARGQGPFSSLGEAVFLDYWRNYPRYKSKPATRSYRDLRSYSKWKKNQGQKKQ